MYHPTTRVLAVLALLQTYGRMTGSELSRRLEIHARTVRRYIIMLQDLGIPIQAERGRSGAYVLMPGYKLPPMMFTNEEAVALSIGLLAARQLGLAEMDRAVESALAKLERVMPDEIRHRVRALTESVDLGAGMNPVVSPDAATLSSVSSAIQSMRSVRMNYKSKDEGETHREFDPYGVAFLHRKWYVVGYCHLRKGLRSFRLDRIRKVELTDRNFKRPVKFDTLGYVVQAIATLPRAYSFEALLKTNIDTARREIHSALGTMKAVRGGVVFRGSVDDIDWLARQFAQVPFDFVVRTPPELKRALERLSAALAKLARATK